jgi:hypothetical protein
MLVKAKRVILSQSTLVRAMVIRLVLWVLAEDNTSGLHLGSSFNSVLRQASADQAVPFEMGP